MSDDDVPPRFPGVPKLVSVETFWKDMMQMKSKGWYYAHRRDPDFPKPYKLGNRVYLEEDECVAYIRSLKGKSLKRAEPPLPAHFNLVGRPRKMNRSVAENDETGHFCAISQHPRRW